MPLSKVQFKPGDMKDDTPLSSEGGWVDSQWIRDARSAADDIPRPQTMGGFELLTSAVGTGKARGMTGWADKSGLAQLAYGTPSHLYNFNGGTLSDITPLLFELYLSDPFAVQNGSATVAVTHNVFTPSSNTAVVIPHGLKVGDTVTFRFADAVGGITPDGSYTVVSTPTPTTYTITHGSAATSTAGSGGGKVIASAVLAAGLSDGAGGLGYGTGTYGTGSYGLPNVSDYLPAIWSLQPWGERLLALRRGSPLFEFQPQISYAEIITNGNFTSTDGWAFGTGWSGAGGIATATAGTSSNLSQNVTNRMEGGRVYRITFDVTRSAGTLTFGINAGKTTPAVVTLGTALNKSGSYSIRVFAPADPLDVVWTKDNAFAGTVDNISVKVEADAYRLDEAPIASEVMFVDPNQIAILGGTFQANGLYNPMAVRTSDRQNNRSWVPSNANLSTEYVLGKGGRIVGGLPTRNQNIIYTDEAAYGMTFTGIQANPYNYSLLGTGCGLIGRHAVVEHGGFVFWMSNSRNFYAVTYDFQGAVPRPIECSGRKHVFDNIAVGQEEKCFAIVLKEFNEVMWCYPDARISNEVNSYALFNITTQTWRFGRLNRTAGTSAGVWPYPILAGYDGDGNTRLYFHEKGHSANGDALESWLTCAPFDAGDGDTLMNITRAVFDFKGQRGGVSLQFFGQGFPNSPTRQTAVMDIGPTDTKKDFRFTARRLWFTLRAFSAPSSWRLGVPHIDAAPSGARR